MPRKRKPALHVILHPVLHKCRLYLHGKDISRYVKKFGHDFSETGRYPYRVELTFPVDEIIFKLADEEKGENNL